MPEMQMGRCVMDGAYEIAEIIMDGGLLEKWMNEGEELPHTLDETLAAWYLYNPKPAPEDIAGVVDLRAVGPRYSLRFKIRRGKEMLTAFLNQHRNASIVTMGEGVLLNCWDCDKELVVPWDSLGHLGGELVRQAVAPASDAPENSCTGFVQRAVYSSDSGSTSQRGEGSAGTNGSH